MRRKLGRAEIKGVSVISYDLVDVGVIFMKFRAPQALKDNKEKRHPRRASPSLSTSSSSGVDAAWPRLARAFRTAPFRAKP